MKIRNLILSGIVALGGVVFLCTGSSMADVNCPTGTERAGESVKTMAECSVEADDSLMPTVKNIINALIGVVGIISVVMIVIGGISYATSQGDPAKTKRATQTLLFSVIGLVVAILAFAIVNFVLANVF